LQLFHWTDGSTTVDYKMAEIDAYLKQQEVIEFMVAEGERPAFIQTLAQSIL
jgi:hypothetical protein